MQKLGYEPSQRSGLCEEGFRQLRLVGSSRGQITYHKPCKVHESSGPIAGLVSQNCVWRSCPPGYMKQQLSGASVLLWHESGLSMGQLGALPNGT